MIQTWDIFFYSIEEGKVTQPPLVEELMKLEDGQNYKCFRELMKTVFPKEIADKIIKEAMTYVQE
jgi:hypothetical protein